MSARGPAALGPAAGRRPLSYADLEGRSLQDFTTPEDLADLADLAGPWPVRWLFEDPDGPDRAVHLFAGCGGWCVGIRRILGITVDMVCVDMNADAVATSNAAGCHAIQADVTTLDPEHPALRWTRILICSPPCTDWTQAGKRLGHLEANILILEKAIDRACWAAGNVINDGSELCFHDDPADCTETCTEHYIARSGETWDEVRAITHAMSAKTAGLMLEILIWAQGLWCLGAPLETIAVEQSAALPEAIKNAITAELTTHPGWDGNSGGFAPALTWEEIDAFDYGSPSHRRRTFLTGHRYGRRTLQRPTLPGTNAADAIGWDRDTVVVTRGNRKTAGGNGFVLGRNDGIPGVTSKIRGWYTTKDAAARFTIPEIAKLVSLPPDHPFIGSRTSACQQAADVVAPVVSAAVIGTLMGVPWLHALRRYLAKLYKPPGRRPRRPQHSDERRTAAQDSRADTGSCAARRQVPEHRSRDC
ncbi:MAG: DNA cytosine methyltransferase [Streptomycetaceae bacterium]|nr:DNA cytosine methyltransferase [Streptomycetaceae bacterium]